MCTGAEVWAISTSSDLGVRARAFAGFFSSSLLVVVCLGKKKGSLLRRPLWIVASPIPRTSCSTYATRPCLPPSKMGETPPFPYPPNGVSNPHFTPHPHREHTRAPDFSRAAGRWGVGACSVGLSGRRPAGAVSRVLMSHSIIYFEKALLFPIACVCVCMCVCMFVCACVCAYLRKGLVNVFSVLGRELQFAPFFLPQCSCRRTLSSWRCFFFFCAFEGRHHHTTIPTHLFPPPPLFYSFRNF